MASFNLEALKRSGSKPAGTQDYGFLIDQLSIKQNQLESDGKLSSGDYDILESMAKKLYTNPGLTPDQRSSISVKISSYQSDKKINSFKDTSDIDKLNRDVKDANSKAKNLFITDPTKYLKANGAIEKAKLDKLTATIERVEASQGDATKYYDERDTTLLDYQNTLQALDDIEKKNPNTNYATYMVTNSYGEIVDMKVGKIGSVTGYIPTNGTYGGLPIYGKTNRVNELGKNVFTLGDQNFVEGKEVVATADGYANQKKLILEGMSTRGTAINKGKVEVDPTKLRAQNEIRREGWAEGDKGTIYQRGTDGNYTKYLNTDKAKLGLKDGDVLKLDSYKEQAILPYVATTTDAMANNVPPPMPPAPVAPTVGTTSPSMTSTTTPSITPKGTKNTGGAPTERSSQTASGVAGGMMGKVKSFFGGLFGK